MSPETPWIGAAEPRVDGPVKVTGTAIYTGDVALPDLAHAVLVQSTIAKGRITGTDIAAAETAPGVLAVYISDGSLGIGPVASFYSADNGPMGDGRTPLSDPVIHHHGQHIAMVVAETLEQAVAGAESIRTRYRHEAPLVRIEDAIAQTPPGREDIVRGDLATGLAVADVTVEAYYETPPQHMNPMEPGATTARWSGDRLTVYDSTQYVGGVRVALAAAFGLPVDKVRVLSGFVGGGFGSKGTVWPHVLLAAAAARRVGRPVRLVLTRPQMFTSCGTRPATRQRIVLGAHRDGRLTAIAHDGTTATSPGENVVESTGGITSTLYACPNVAIRQRIVRLDMQAPTFQRGPGRAPDPSRWNPRSTSWPTNWAWIRWSCGCAITPTPTRRRVGRGRASTFGSATARAPSGSVGNRTTAHPAPAARATC